MGGLAIAAGLAYFHRMNLNPDEELIRKYEGQVQSIMQGQANDDDKMM